MFAKFMNAAGVVVVLVILLAVLNHFDGDPFMVVQWIWDRTTSFLSSAADWLSSSRTFQIIVGDPKK